LRCSSLIVILKDKSATETIVFGLFKEMRE